MNKTAKIVLWIVVLVLIIWGISSISKNANQVADTGPIKIGFIGPLTGDAAAYGEPISNSVKMAEKQINDAGGINNRQVQVIFEDAKCDGQTAASAAQKLVNVDKVKF